MLQRATIAWHQALDRYVAEHADRPFAWGEHDCCTFVSGWVQLCTGADPMLDVRGYGAEAVAQALLEADGGLLGAATARLGDPRPPLTARAGDVVLVRHGSRQSMGVCIGEHVAVPGIRRQQLVSLAAAEAAWPVC